MWVEIERSGRCADTIGHRATMLIWLNDGMVLRRVALAVTGFSRPAGRRSRDAKGRPDAESVEVGDA